MQENLPDFETFKRLCHQARESGKQRFFIPLVRRLFSDTLTPVLAYRRLVRPDERMAPSFLLESVVGGQNIGRYSYLGAQPSMEVIARGHQVTWRINQQDAGEYHFDRDDPLKEMDRITGQWSQIAVPGLPDFVGGWVGYAGYDTVRYLEGEKLPHPPQDDRGLPDLHMQLYSDVVAFDHVQKTVMVITHVFSSEQTLAAMIDQAAKDDPSPQSATPTPSLEQAYEAGIARLDEMTHRLVTPWEAADGPEPEMPTGHVDLAAPPRKLPVSTMGEGGYQRAVEKCKKYIQAGDIFQVVPSQRFDLTTKADPFDIYRALRVVNPSPYMFYLQIDGGMLVGSSPEILCRVHNRQVINRPLAGTRRRGATAAEDQQLEAELLADPKDRAEHIMLVDLGRNDVGRIAKAGSIELPEVLAIERYSHVMHLSSTVTGTLGDDCTCWDALRVTLPVGTVSGAPKVRAMQIIDELEPRRRGPYAGAVGYVDYDGNMDMAIALRTMVVMPGQTRSTWAVHIQAGGGIVADSDPDAEHQETVNKAAALAKAVDLAEAAFVT